MAIHVVRVSAEARKNLLKVPRQVLNKFENWVASIQEDGLELTRVRPGFHDEPLQGSRRGQRSIRLNRSYRGIYRIGRDGEVEFVSVEEVNKHEY